MADDFSLPEIPLYENDALIKLHEEGDLNQPSFELVKILGLAAFQTISLQEDTAEFKDNLETVKYRIALGHICKALRLSMSVLELASKDKYGDAVEILSGQIIRTGIQFLWLIKGAQERVDLYIKNSLAFEKETFDIIKKRDMGDDLTFYTDYLASTFKEVGIEIESFEFPKEPLPSFIEMLRDINADQPLFLSYDLSHHSFKITYMDLIKWYIKEEEGIYIPQDSHIPPTPYHISSIGLFLCKVMEEFCGQFFTYEAVRKEFTEYYQRFYQTFFTLYDFSLLRMMPNYVGNLKKEMAHKPTKKVRKTSDLNSHIMVKKELIPPLMKMDNITLQSWMNDRFPEMLWAIILVVGLGRDKSFSIFNRIINYFGKNQHLQGDITFTGILNLDGKSRAEILFLITQDDEAKNILGHLHLFDSIPGKMYWSHFIGESPENESWEFLGKCFLVGVDEQSVETTDCRWLKIAVLTALGRMNLPTKEDYERIFKFPINRDRGSDSGFFRSMEAITPKINSAEVKWIKEFWEECFNKTRCIPQNPGIPTQRYADSKLNMPSLLNLYDTFQKTYFNHLPSTTIEPKYDTFWGISLYIAFIAKEILKGNEARVLGTLGLRTIAEALINLKYLLKVNDDKQWEIYRNYGVGQAKLIKLKSAESADIPHFIPLERLSNIANEDRWEEFSSMMVGDWSGKNLKSRSEKAGAKELYDRFFLWPSSLGHANWAAVRCMVFENCVNPAHRFHRYPITNTLKTVKYDLEFLISYLLDLLNSEYPDLNFMLKEEVTTGHQLND